MTPPRNTPKQTTPDWTTPTHNTHQTPTGPNHTEPHKVMKKTKWEPQRALRWTNTATPSCPLLSTPEHHKAQCAGELTTLGLPEQVERWHRCNSPNPGNRK